MQTEDTCSHRVTLGLPSQSPNLLAKQGTGVTQAVKLRALGPHLAQMPPLPSISADWDLVALCYGLAGAAIAPSLSSLLPLLHPSLTPLDTDNHFVCVGVHAEGFVCWWFVT